MPLGGRAGLTRLMPPHKIFRRPDVKNSLPRSKFMIGNILLAIALGTLLFMGSLSERFGFWAVVLWMVLAAAGIYFIMADKNDPSEPD